MNLKFKQKKGDPTDVLIVGIMLLALAIGFIFVILVGTEIKSGLDDTPIADNQYYNTTMSSLETITTTGINNGFLFLFIGLIISILISSFLIRVHPAFIIIYLIIMVFSVIIGMVLSNTYEEVASSDQLAVYASNYPALSWIMAHIVEIMIIVGVLSLIVIFAKPIGDAGGGI